METTHTAMVIGNGNVPCRGANDETDIESYPYARRTRGDNEQGDQHKDYFNNPGKKWHGPWLLVVELEERGQLRERKWQKSLEEAGRTQGIWERGILSSGILSPEECKKNKVGQEYALCGSKYSGYPGERCEKPPFAGTTSHFHISGLSESPRCVIAQPVMGTCPANAVHLM